MGNNAQLAAVLAAGYLLGRSKKMKLAMMIASSIAFGKLKSNDNEGLMALGKKLQDSPEIKRATEKITGGLADAAKGAAIATASRGVDSLSKNLQERSANLRAATKSGGGDSSESSDTESSGQASGEESSESSSGGGSNDQTPSAEDSASESSADESVNDESSDNQSSASDSGQGDQSAESSDDGQDTIESKQQNTSQSDEQNGGNENA